MRLLCYFEVILAFLGVGWIACLLVYLVVALLINHLAKNACADHDMDLLYCCT